MLFSLCFLPFLNNIKVKRFQGLFWEMGRKRDFGKIDGLIVWFWKEMCFHVFLLYLLNKDGYACDFGFWQGKKWS